MNRFWPISSALTITALALIAAPALAAIFGSDDRKAVPKHLTKPAKAVGILRAPGQGSSNECNAACIAPRVIATSAHCLYFPVRNGSRPNLQAITFRNANGASMLAGAREGRAEWNVIAGATYEAEETSWIVSHDWALAKLAKPVCAGVALEISARNKWGDLFDAVLNDEVFVISNNRYRRGLRQQYAGPCDAGQFTLAQAARWLLIDLGSNDPKHLIPHRCDFKRGASGSPLLLERDGKILAVGINAAESDRRKLESKLGDEAAQQLSANFAVSVAAFEKQLEMLRAPATPLPVDELRALQGELRALGLYTSRPDGRFGRATRQAVLDFERRYGLLPTGRPSAALRLSAAAAAAAPQAARAKAVELFAEPARPKNRILVLHGPSGHFESGLVGAGVNAANVAEMTLAACRAASDADCKLFAVGDDIVFDRPQAEIDRMLERLSAMSASAN